MAFRSPVPESLCLSWLLLSSGKEKGADYEGPEKLSTGYGFRLVLADYYNNYDVV